MFDNVVDVDVANERDIAFPRTLDVGIVGGTQEFPPQANPEDVANRLLIFTGTAIFAVGKDGNLNRPTVRVRLRFPLTASVKYVGSATVAALASIHGSNDSECVFGADAAETIVGPSGNRGLPTHGLPDDELYILINTAIMGEQALLLRVAYQANVLILNTEPDLDSILVRPANSNVAFAKEATLSSGDRWEYLLTLTGPVTDPPAVFGITLQTSDPQAAPIDVLHILNQLTTGQISGGSRVNSPVTGGGSRQVIITATGNRAVKTATLNILPPVR